MTTTTARVVPPYLPRMAEIVASQLRVRIISGNLQDGDELPREALLLEEFGVSRPSLREAIRILETEGLIRIRRGKVGGAVVTTPNSETAAYHLGLTLQARSTTLGDVATARKMLEPMCAGMVAGLPDDKRAVAIERLRELMDENVGTLGEDGTFTQSALTFHAALVEMCGNTSISILTSALDSVWSTQELHWAQRKSAAGDYPVAKYQRSVIKSHAKIIKLIVDGDAAGAEEAMREHLASSQSYVGDDNVVLEALPHR